MTLQTINPDAVYFVDELAKARKALRWALENGVSGGIDKNGKLNCDDSGCGCCSGSIQPPEELRAAIVAALTGPGEPNADR